MPDFCATQLEKLFRQVLGDTWNTRLEGGNEEPFYQPPAGGEPARILYTRDYFRSALHEVAHWCIAGEIRRRQRDYGYWYLPDGRTSDQQRLFLEVEKKPQAIELLFCCACGHDFFVSLDNLDGEPGEAVAFEDSVRDQAFEWLARGGVPPRASQWIEALAAQYGQPLPSREGVKRVFRPLFGEQARPPASGQEPAGRDKAQV